MNWFLDLQQRPVFQFRNRVYRLRDVKVANFEKIFHSNFFFITYIYWNTMWRCVFFIWFLTFQDNKQQHLQVHQQMTSNWIINHSWNKVAFKHVKSLIFYLLRFISASFKGSFFLICKQVCRICFSLLSFIISVFFKRLLVCFALTSFKPFPPPRLWKGRGGGNFPLNFSLPLIHDDSKTFCICNQCKQ